MKIYVAWQGIHSLGGVALGSTTFPNVDSYRTQDKLRQIELKIMELNALQVVSINNIIELTDENEGSEKAGPSVPVEKLADLIVRSKYSNGFAILAAVQRLISEAK